MRAGREPIVIAGAGVGGLAAAAALRRRGFAVRLFERAGAVTAPRGSGLTIWGNAMNALAVLGLDGRLAERGVALERQLTLSASGSVLQDLPVGEIQRQWGRVGVGVRRQDVLEVLLEAAGGAELHLGEEVCGVRERAGGELAVDLTSGEEIVTELLIGADGLRSRVRAALVGDGPPKPLNHTVWRGVSDGAGSFPVGASLMVFGPRGTRMVAWAVAADRVCWSVARNGVPLAGGAEDTAVRETLLEEIATFPVCCREVLAASAPERIIRTDLFAREQVRLVAGRVALLGDAAHAMPTVFGQGAAMAIEDALVLAAALAAHPRDPAGALREYEWARLSRLLRVRAHVRRASRLQKLSNPIALSARSLLLRHMPGRVSRRMWSDLLAFPGDLERSVRGYVG